MGQISDHFSCLPTFGFGKYLHEKSPYPFPILPPRLSTQCACSHPDPCGSLYASYRLYILVLDSSLDSPARARPVLFRAHSLFSVWNAVSLTRGPQHYAH